MLVLVFHGGLWGFNGGGMDWGFYGELVVFGGFYGELVVLGGFYGELVVFGGFYGDEDWLNSNVVA